MINNIWFNKIKPINKVKIIRVNKTLFKHFSNSIQIKTNNWKYKNTNSDLFIKL